MPLCYKLLKTRKKSKSSAHSLSDFLRAACLHSPHARRAFTHTHTHIYLFVCKTFMSFLPHISLFCNQILRIFHFTTGIFLAISCFCFLCSFLFLLLCLFAYFLLLTCFCFRFYLSHGRVLAWALECSHLWQL